MGSCASIVPFTDNIAEQVGGEDQLDKFQYYVSRTIVLDKMESDSKASLSDGKAKLVNRIEKNKVTIKESTPGVVLDHSRNGMDGSSRTYILNVAFERDDDYFLKFKRRMVDDDKYYIITGKNDWIYYGDGYYKYSSPVKRKWFGFGEVKQEDAPYLMIKLNQKLIKKEKKRTAKGRKL